MQLHSATKDIPTTTGSIFNDLSKDSGSCEKKAGNAVL